MVSKAKHHNGCSGPTDGPANEANVIPMAALRLAREEIAHEAKHAVAMIGYCEEFGTRKERAEAKRIVKAFHVASALIEAAIKDLSGGFKQKK
jgi:hypothetical protein